MKTNATYRLLYKAVQVAIGTNKRDNSLESFRRRKLKREVAHILCTSIYLQRQAASGFLSPHLRKMLKFRLRRSHRFRLLASNLVHKGETRLLAPSEWQRMPTELVENVFDIFLVHFSDSATPYLCRRSILQPALRAMACVSRHWYIMATEVLYEHIYVESHAALDMLAKTMTDCNNKHLPPLVQSLQMGADILISLRKANKNAKQIRNYRMICHVCPNLTYIHQWRSRDYVGDIIEANNLDISKLTHLEISLGGNLVRPHKSATFLGSIKELPAVQELTIRAYADGSIGRDQRRHTFDSVVLPVMPCLHRLSIIGWDARSCFMSVTNFDFPPVRVLEYINCSIDSFHSLLWSSTIERLVIKDPAYDPSHEDVLENAFAIFHGCDALTHMCIPFSVFQSCHMPHNLQYLLLDATIEKEELEKAEDDLVSFFDLMVVARRSDRPASRNVERDRMACLKHVHIVCPNVVGDKSTFRYEWHNSAEAARKANVTFTVSTEGLQGHKTNNKIVDLPDSDSSENSFP